MVEAINILLKRFREKNTQTKILGRPDLLDWLFELATQTAEKESGNAFLGNTDTVERRLVRIHTELCKLIDASPPNMNRSIVGRKPKPFETSPVFFLSAEEWPDYYAAADRSASDADDLMVEWFAAWAVQEASNFRKFSVVARVADATLDMWKGKWRHLSFFDPKEFVERIKQVEGGKG